MGRRNLIVTHTSRIVKADGENVTLGRLIITPNAPFEWDGPGGREKVTRQPVVITITNGIIPDVQLAPTQNAGSDTNNLEYKAIFDVPGGSWFELWTIDANGPSLLEITDVVIQQSSIAPTVVISTAAGKGLPIGGTVGQMLRKYSPADYDLEWAPNALERSNHSGTQPASTISGLGSAALMNTGIQHTDVAFGDHAHNGIYEPANPNISAHINATSNPHNVTTKQLLDFNTSALNGGYF